MAPIENVSPCRFPADPRERRAGKRMAGGARIWKGWSYEKNGRKSEIAGFERGSKCAVVRRVIIFCLIVA